MERELIIKKILEKAVHRLPSTSMKKRLKCHITNSVIKHDLASAPSRHRSKGEGVILPRAKAVNDAREA